ncbi:MAG: hypothetical protein MJ140_05280 [Ligilactobacillus sp.]|nr:hypothetical protein [Ligilactobacillus sp.]
MLLMDNFKEIIQANQFLNAGSSIAGKRNALSVTQLEVDNYFVPISELSDFY